MEKIIKNRISRINDEKKRNLAEELMKANSIIENNWTLEKLNEYHNSEFYTYIREIIDYCRR